MCVNKIKLKTAYKNNHLSIKHSNKLHTMAMGQHFLAIGEGGGVLANDKHRKE